MSQQLSSMPITATAGFRIRPDPSISHLAPNEIAEWTAPAVEAFH
jgi:hypothetical protein